MLHYFSFAKRVHNTEIDERIADFIAKSAALKLQLFNKTITLWNGEFIVSGFAAAFHKEADPTPKIAEREAVNIAVIFSADCSTVFIMLLHSYF